MFKVYVLDSEGYSNFIAKYLFEEDAIEKVNELKDKGANAYYKI